MKDAAIATREDGSLMLYIFAIEDWDGLVEIGQYLEREFDARFTKKIDGPDARVWLGKIDTYPVKLWHDVYGNTLYAGANSMPLLERIKQRLEERLAELNSQT